MPMPMDLPPEAVAIGDNAYLFPSPIIRRRIDQCFIVGHGGALAGNPAHFTVPAGCTLYFLVDAKENYLARGPVSGFKAISKDSNGAAPVIKAENTFAGGSRCVDYVLEKAHGSHMDRGLQLETFQEKSYLAISQTMNELIGDYTSLKWIPHYVSIRNRTSSFTNQFVYMSKLISDIRKYRSHITEFYCAYCRSPMGYPSSDKRLKNIGEQKFQ
jgi:hypothetical protein